MDQLGVGAAVKRVRQLDAIVLARRGAKYEALERWDVVAEATGENSFEAQCAQGDYEAAEARFNSALEDFWVAARKALATR